MRLRTDSEMRLTSSSSDGSVIRASVSKPQAFAALFDRHARAIWGYACRRVGPALADEVVNETFLRAFSGRSGYDVGFPDARPWLFGIATNVIREHARGEARSHRDVEMHREASDYGDAELDRVEARADAAARIPATVAALARLEPVDRETLLLYALTDLHYEQIATATDVPVGTVRSRLNRARRVMQAELGLPGTDSGERLGAADERSQR